MITEYNLYDNMGKQMTHIVREKRSSLGKGWVAMYKKATRELVVRLQPLQLKVFVYLCLKQSYELYVVITNKELAKQIGASYNRVLEAMKELERMNVVRRGRFDGLNLVVINPMFTVCGATTKGDRLELWSMMNRYYSLEQTAVQTYDESEQTKILRAATAVAREIYELVEKTFEGADIDDETGDYGEDNQSTPEEISSGHTNAGGLREDIGLHTQVSD